MALNTSQDLQNNNIYLQVLLRSCTKSFGLYCLYSFRLWWPRRVVEDWTLLVASCMQLRVYNKQVTKLKLSSPCHIEIPLCGQCCRLGCWCYFVDVVFILVHAPMVVSSFLLFFLAPHKDFYQGFLLNPRRSFYQLQFYVISFL